jgi:hypothetical protein
MGAATIGGAAPASDTRPPFPPPLSETTESSASAAAQAAAPRAERLAMSEEAISKIVGGPVHAEGEREQTPTFRRMVQVLGGERRMLLGGLRGRKGHSLILAAACSLACLAVLGQISMSGEMWGGDGGATMLVGGGAAGAAAAVPQFDEAAAAAKCQALTSRSSCMREPLNPDRRARFARLCFYDRRARTCKIS